MDISMLSVDGSFTETPLIPVFNTVISEEVRAKETHWKKQFFAVSDVDVKWRKLIGFFALGIEKP